MSEMWFLDLRDYARHRNTIYSCLVWRRSCLNLWGSAGIACLAPSSSSEFWFGCGHATATGQEKDGGTLSNVWSSLLIMFRGTHNKPYYTVNGLILFLTGFLSIRLCKIMWIFQLLFVVFMQHWFILSTITYCNVRLELSTVVTVWQFLGPCLLEL